MNSYVSILETTRLFLPINNLLYNITCRIGESRLTDAVVAGLCRFLEVNKVMDCLQ